jgi:hypothetical protein
MIAKIVALLKERAPNDMALRLENKLYRGASSKERYSDESTLKQRLNTNVAMMTKRKAVDAVDDVAVDESQKRFKLSDEQRDALLVSNHIMMDTIWCESLKKSVASARFTPLIPTNIRYIVKDALLDAKSFEADAKSPKQVVVDRNIPHTSYKVVEQKADVAYLQNIANKEITPLFTSQIEQNESGQLSLDNRLVAIPPHGSNSKGSSSSLNEPKFKKGDKVWFMEDDREFHVEIISDPFTRDPCRPYLESGEWMYEARRTDGCVFFGDRIIAFDKDLSIDPRKAQNISSSESSSSEEESEEEASLKLKNIALIETQKAAKPEPDPAAIEMGIVPVDTVDNHDNRDNRWKEAVENWNDRQEEYEDDKANAPVTLYCDHKFSDFNKKIKKGLLKRHEGMPTYKDFPMDNIIKVGGGCKVSAFPSSHFHPDLKKDDTVLTNNLFFAVKEDKDGDKLLLSLVKVEDMEAWNEFEACERFCDFYNRYSFYFEFRYSKEEYDTLNKNFNVTSYTGKEFPALDDNYTNDFTNLMCVVFQQDKECDTSFVIDEMFEQFDIFETITKEIKEYGRERVMDPKRDCPIRSRQRNVLSVPAKAPAKQREISEEEMEDFKTIVRYERSVHDCSEEITTLCEKYDIGWTIDGIHDLRLERARKLMTIECNK